MVVLYKWLLVQVASMKNMLTTEIYRKKMHASLRVNWISGIRAEEMFIWIIQCGCDFHHLNSTLKSHICGQKHNFSIKLPFSLVFQLCCILLFAQKGKNFTHTHKFTCMQCTKIILYVSNHLYIYLCIIYIWNI